MSGLTVAAKLRLLADDSDNMGQGVLDSADLREWANELERDMVWRVDNWTRALEALAPDAHRFRNLVEFDAIALNKWLVQARWGEKWGTCYFADPPSGAAENKAATKLDALRSAFDAARA